MTADVPQPVFAASQYSVRELLSTYVAILDELKARGLVRTRNSPLGDLAESLALRAYGGTLAPNSEKSHDLMTEDGIRIQVKARAQEPGEKRTQIFSAVRSWDFDLALFLLFDSSTYDLTWAREMTRAEAEALGTRREHTNSIAIPVRKVVAHGVDVTAKLSAAYDRIDEPRI